MSPGLGRFHRNLPGQELDPFRFPAGRTVEITSRMSPPRRDTFHAKSRSNLRTAASRFIRAKADLAPGAPASRVLPGNQEHVLKLVLCRSEETRKQLRHFHTDTDMIENPLSGAELPV